MKKIIRTDEDIALVILICSIVIPPLFVINLILYLIQKVIKFHRIRKVEKEIVEEQEMHEMARIIYESEVYDLTSDQKKELLPLLNIVSNSYLGEDQKIIRGFIICRMMNVRFSMRQIEEFTDYMSNLYDIAPDIAKMEELKEAVEILKKVRNEIMGNKKDTT